MLPLKKLAHDADRGLTSPTRHKEISVKRPCRSTSLLSLSALALTLTAVVVLPRFSDEETTAPPVQAAATPLTTPSPSRTAPGPGPGLGPEAELVQPFLVPSAQPPGVLGSNGDGAVLEPGAVQVPTPPTRTEAPHAVIRPA